MNEYKIITKAVYIIAPNNPNKVTSTTVFILGTAINVTTYP